MPQSKYSGLGSSGGNDYDNVTVKFSPFTAVSAEIDSVFGNSQSWGQSLGVSLTDVALTDGGLYFDADKGKYKTFSVGEAAGMSIEDALERGMDVPTVDDFDEVITKTYFGNTKTYDLVSARVEVPDDVDGDSTSKTRTVEQDGDSINVGEWDYYDGEPVPVPDTISWYSGNEEHGPSASAKSAVSLLTENGGDNIVSEDNVSNWLADVSGDNLLRSDLEGRRVELITMRYESSDENMYNSLVAIDLQTGERISPNNRTGGGSGNEDGPVRDETPSGQYPEPVADFISTAGSLDDMNPDRAADLLDEIIADPQNALSDADVEDAGGRGVVIQEVV